MRKKTKRTSSALRLKAEALRLLSSPEMQTAEGGMRQTCCGKSCEMGTSDVVTNDL